MAESGFAGYEASSWYGILAPAGTSRDVVGRLYGEIAKAVRQPDVMRAFETEGAEPIGGTPQEFAEHIRGELDRLGKAARAARIEAN